MTFLKVLRGLEFISRVVEEEEHWTRNQEMKSSYFAITGRAHSETPRGEFSFLMGKELSQVNGDALSSSPLCCHDISDNL